MEAGAIGIEFLSRGCEKAFLCDKSHEAINVIKKNVQKTRFEEQVAVINDDYKKCLKRLAEENVKFDIVFLDPPYANNIAVDATKLIIELELLKDDGIIIIETDQEERELEGLGKLKSRVYDCRKYGRVCLIFLS